MMGLTDIRDSFDLDGEVTETPMSRTHQYRKVMKPMFERRRRARINKCLDELKDLMVVALQTEGESITKLEKADVLELTVRHLKKLRRQQMLTINPHLNQDKYRSGFTACATEVSRCLGSLPSVDANTRSKLMNHLGQRLASVSASDPPPHQPPSGLTIRVPVPTYPVPVKVSPQSPLQDSDLGYNSGRDSTPSPSHPESSKFAEINAGCQRDSESVWRPF